MTTASRQATTHAFARVLGPFFTIVSATVVARSADMPKLLAEFDSSAVWPWVTGAFVLMTGIIVIALHPYWRGAPAVIVSLLGWIMVVRGILLMGFPGFFMSIANRTIGAEGVWRAVFAVLVLVGLYLTYTGWIARAKPSVSPGQSPAPDLPRAA
ncbi:hypothetical protein H7J71_20085 [Mycolicibacterium peregrinum]|uniref:hypothetical protein n=1 Tax=Mycolicibacterium peregrinum TaxID=43304 RepID=UPI0006D7D067|nr:hypothetical protein [Mycolicibacterium peregrinum]MCV7204313.1 hypothetical protein [Mycolicibacterium peregrinum]ORW50661.1 hypothetical protein AWC21_32295 [Mycolicibacterium peregrinum]